jgi:hypothetical protein
MAEPHAAGLAHQNGIYQLILIKGFQEGVQGCLCTGSDTAGSHADNNLNFFTFSFPAPQVRLGIITELPQFFQCHFGHTSFSLLN